jgi:hypothetical protein
VFLIRLWPAEEGGKPAWRASLASYTAIGFQLMAACLPKETNSQ